MTGSKQNSDKKQTTAAAKYHTNIDKLFQKTFGVWKTNIGAFLGWATVFTLLVTALIALAFWIQGVANLEGLVDSGHFLGSSTLDFLAYLVGVLLFAPIGMWIIAKAEDGYKKLSGEKVEKKSLWQKLDNFVAFFAVGLTLVFLEEIVSWIGLMSEANHGSVWGLAAFLTMIMWIYLGYKWIFAEPISALRGKSAIESFKMSWGMSKNRWWRLLSYNVLFTLLLGVIVLAMGALIYFLLLPPSLSDALEGIVAGTFSNFGTAALGLLVIGIITLFVIAVLLILLVVFQVVLFLEIEKEGPQEIWSSDRDN